MKALIYNALYDLIRQVVRANGLSNREIAEALRDIADDYYEKDED